VYECADSAVRKELKVSSDGGDIGIKKYNRGYDGACGGVWRSLLLVEVWRQAAGFCVGTFGKNSSSVAMKMF
jgi:hypothetical protein